MELTDFQYKPTQCLYKVSKLLKRKEPISIIRGGQGAGKTVGIEMLLIDWHWRNPELEITICSHERTKLMATAFDDFKKILIDWNLWDQGKFNGQTSRWTWLNSQLGFIEFIGLDVQGVGKGRRRDMIYINEVNKINLEKYIDISARAKRLILDYNPDTDFWIDEFCTDDNLITVTYQDNQYLSKEEIKTIESYKLKAFYNPDLENYDIPSNVKNPYWANKWRVYGLGLPGQIEGAIFTRWSKGRFNDELPYIFCVDWGTKDPFVLLKFALDDKKKKIYIKELVYEPSGERGERWLMKMVRNYCTPNDLIIADSAEMITINSFRGENYNMQPCFKRPGIVVERIKWIQDYQLVIDDSPNIERELLNYIWSDKRGEVPIDNFNHAIDALGYGMTYYKMNVLRQ